jgi:biotin carboxyl carrier protein
MSNYRLKIQGKTFDVDLTSMNSGTATVRVGQNTYEVEIEGGTPARVAPMRPPSAMKPEQTKLPASSTGNGNDIRAPMPGLILDIMVKQGDSVSAKQAVLKMETMKMENEIRSPRDGVVASVLVNLRQDVDQGQVLVTLEK